ncbi:MAG: hypothetical protein ACO3A4_05055 [Silvanigrellaceae bacterium]
MAFSFHKRGHLPLAGLCFGLKIRVLLLASVFFIPSCKQSPASTSAQTLSAKTFLSPQNIHLLQERRGQILAWSLRCDSSVAKENCDVGDAALFNGLLCLSGDGVSCEAVRRSQGTDGRMWRASTRVEADSINSFSRDMAVGVLAYLVATRDVELAQRWMNWIEKNDFRLCAQSTDNRCDFTPGFWMLFRDVWEFLGLQTHEKMNASVVEDSVMALLQAQFAPPGFEMHLAGVNALIRQSMGQKSQTLASLSQMLATRQPRNPFFAYLSLRAMPEVVAKTLDWCPATQPLERAEWSFERDESREAWNRSMGWECVMLANFLVRDLAPR